MITNREDENQLFKKLDWLEQNGYEEKDVIQDEDGEDYVVSIEDAEIKRILLDQLEI